MLVVLCCLLSVPLYNLHWGLARSETSRLVPVTTEEVQFV